VKSIHYMQEVISTTLMGGTELFINMLIIFTVISQIWGQFYFRHRRMNGSVSKGRNGLHS
jgi:hypothetical protein